jgi:hypothetical protein
MDRARRSPLDNDRCRPLQGTATQRARHHAASLLDTQAPHTSCQHADHRATPGQKCAARLFSTGRGAFYCSSFFLSVKNQSRNRPSVPSHDTPSHHQSLARLAWDTATYAPRCCRDESQQREHRAGQRLAGVHHCTSRAHHALRVNT